VRRERGADRVERWLVAPLREVRDGFERQRHAPDYASERARMVAALEAEVLRDRRSRRVRGGEGGPDP
jgi:hypothetical protein